jgi:hypothetical protein
MQASTLGEILEYMTMVGEPSITSTPDALQAVSSFRRLWSLLFPGGKDDQQLQTLHPEQPTSGYVVYHEMKLGFLISQAKASI